MKLIKYIDYTQLSLDEKIEYDLWLHTSNSIVSYLDETASYDMVSIPSTDDERSNMMDYSYLDKLDSRPSS